MTKIGTTKSQPVCEQTNTDSSLAHNSSNPDSAFTKRTSPGRRASILSLAVTALVIPGLLATAAPATAATPASTSQSVSVAQPAVTTTAVAPATTAVKHHKKKPNLHKRVVKFAKRYHGVAYRYGGESPHGFDCSGFVAYVYRHVGIRLPHSGVAQGRKGYRVARSQAHAGDVVVIDGGSHVGIYMGHGRMFDAPMPGRTVGNHKIYTNNYYLVRFRK
ncbi:MAG: NlpC/P60 family protein [Glaciihabitans sp.]|nr:NlpC/P60 family protein [Glaciihabitans sp.]MDQ1556095.1 peptidoglycan DL-endopeptidase CwlO [Actinomycetota bacterium]